jgi:Flp pilus assembly protein TadG
VEFALIAPVFLLLLFGIIESSLLLLHGVMIEGAAQEAGRQIRTGGIKKEADPILAFKTLLCDKLYKLVDCNGLVYDVRSYMDFTSAEIPALYDAQGNPLPTQFKIGSGGDIIVARVSKTWTFSTPMLSTAYGTDSFILITTVIFRNEPFKW